jgi:Uma2 family endonuclease
MATQPTRRLTWDDLLRMPEAHEIREIVDGELFMTPSPSPRHQSVVLAIGSLLLAWSQAHGGRAFIAPLDVVLDRQNVVEPDVLLFRQGRLGPIGDGYPTVAPDVAVEVSSPSTRGRDRIVKRALYERFGVAEYWIVDLDEEIIEVYTLRSGHYHEPIRFVRGDVVRSEVLAGFAVDFDELVPDRRRS